jgi:hypothetical protein
MVDDHVVRRDRPEGVGLPAAPLGLSVGARADADVPDHHVVRTDVEARLDERDAGRGRGLSRDRHEGLPDVEHLELHVDHAAHLEDDDPRTLRLDRGLERARSVGGEAGHADDPAAAPPGRGRAPADGAGEGGLLRARLRGDEGEGDCGEDCLHHGRSPELSYSTRYS